MRAPAVLLIVVLTVLAAPAASQMNPMQPEYDLLITNARVLDGTGNPWLDADIAVAGERIVYVGRKAEARAARVIDAQGLTVAPGFIDVHSHAAEGLAGPLADAGPLLAQGVTTVVINPDGGGPVDLGAQRAALEATGVGVNVAQLVPHGSIRRKVLGMEDRAPTSEELARMVALVRSGMEAGGVGLSTGLYYAPGSFASTGEVVALARAAAEYGGIYTSHIRDEADYSVGVLAAVDEVIRVAEEAHIPGIVTHMKALGPASWGLSMALTTRVERARGRGVSVYADQYPYEASGTGISAALLPRWALAGGTRALETRLHGADRGRIRDAILQNLARRGGADTLVISGYAPDRTLEGRSLAELARARRMEAADLVLALLEAGDAGLVSFNMDDADIAHIMRQRWTMTCSDGTLTVPGDGKPHPRGYGAFARKLAVWVRERRVISLEHAVRSMTSLPASVFGLKDRGVLRRGARADLVIFDPATVRDTATYTEPHRLAEGISYVLVNGTVAIDAGRVTGRRTGRLLTVQRS